MKPLYFILTSILLITSCETDPLLNPSLDIGKDDNALDETDLCTMAFVSRASGDDDDYTAHTYRTQLFYRGIIYDRFARLDSLITPYTGTYCDPKENNTWLTPCAVDADYAYDATTEPTEDSRYGMRAGREHNYYLVVNSPATAYVKYDEVVKTNPSRPTETAIHEYWGLPYERDGAPKTHPAVSAVANVATKGLDLENTYIYRLDDAMMLREYRSRIAFSVRCGDAISHARLKGLAIEGLRSKAIYRPFSQDFFFNEASPLCGYESTTVYESPDATGILLERQGEPGSFSEGKSVALTGHDSYQQLDDGQQNEYYTYILSGDYKSLDRNNQFINTPPNLCITLASDEGSSIVVDPVPMGFVFEPQKCYYFLITINSVYLAIEVTAREWGADGNSFDIEEVVTPDAEPLTYICNISDWNERTNSDTIEEGGGSSGSTPANVNAGGITSDDWNNPKGGDCNIE